MNCSSKSTSSELVRWPAAAITQFCNCNAIWTGRDQGDVPPGDFVLDTIVDASEAKGAI